MVYVAVQVNGIVSFYKNYVSNGYTATITENMASNYIGVLLILSLVVIIIALIGIIVLLQSKKKPNKVYSFTLFYYIILFVLIIISAILINSLSKGLWGTTSARTYRDLSVIFVLPQYLCILLIGIRALGFDVKKFDFKKDIEELELTEADQEEVELNINFDTTKARRTARRFLRETKYYYLENKFIISVLGGILLVIGAFFVYKNYEKVTYTYSEGKTFNYNSYTIKVMDSMITNEDLHGKKIANISDDSVFLIVKLQITNNALTDRKLTYNNLKLYIDGKYYYPTLDIGNYFIDYGDPYMDNLLRSKDSHTYIIPYVIEQSDASKSAKISIFNGTATKTKEFVAKKIIVKLSPKKYYDTTRVRTANIGEVVSFSGSLIGDSSLTIKSSEFTTRYEYKYESCYDTDNCRTYTDYVVSDTTYLHKLALIVMDYDFTLDSEVALNDNVNSINLFANAFMQVEYTYNNTESIADVTYVTPTRLKDKLILQTDGYIMDAEHVNLIITIRNKSYAVTLK
jgi:hypothetical protein